MRTVELFLLEAVHANARVPTVWQNGTGHQGWVMKGLVCIGRLCGWSRIRIDVGAGGS